MTLIMKPGTSAGVSAESFRDRPYRKLEQELGRVTEVHRIIEQDALSGAEILNQMTAILEREKKKMHEASIRMERLLAVDKELEMMREQDINRAASGTSGTDYSGKDEEEWEVSDRLFQEQQSLLSDPDTRFLYLIHTGISDLSGKCREMEIFKKDPSRYLESKNLSEWARRCEGNVVEASFSINLMVAPKYWPEEHSKSTGLHFPNTIVNAIRNFPDRKADVLDTMHHENRHSVDEALIKTESLLSTAELARILKSMRRRTLALANAKQPALFPGIPNETRKSQFLYRIGEYVNFSKKELLANFDGLKSRELATEISKYLEICEWMDLEAKNEENEFLHTMLLEATELIHKNFRGFIIRLSDLFFIAGEEKLEDELMSGMILFEPSQYGKLGQFMRWKIGNDKYLLYQVIRKAILAPYFKNTVQSDDDETRKMFGAETVADRVKYVEAHEGLSPENMQRVRKIKSNIPLKISEQLQKALNPSQFDFYDAAKKLKDKLPSEVEMYLRDVAKFYTLAGTSVNMDSIEAEIWEEYISCRAVYLVLDIHGGVSEIEEFINSLPGISTRHLSRGLISLAQLLETDELLNADWEKLFAKYQVNFQ